MKKRCLFAVAMTALVCAGTVSAHTGGIYRAAKVNDANIVIDGMFNEKEWTAAQVATIDDYNVPEWQTYGTQLQDGERPDSSEDISAIFKLMYSDKYLYFMAVVKDDVYSAEAPSSGWDSMALYMNGVHDDDSEPLQRIYFTPKVPTAPTGQIFFNNDSVERLKSEGKIVGNVTETGYSVEAAVPIEFIKELYSGWGSTIGIDLQINDNDRPTSGRQTAIVWSGGENMTWQTPSVYGDLIFVK